MTYPLYTNQSEAERYAADNGVRLTVSDREGIRKAQEAELTRLVALDRRDTTSKVTRLVEDFNQFYPRFLKFLIGLGDILLTFTQTMIVSFGVPIVVVLLLLVEQKRVVHGIMFFEVDPSLASFSAWALVIINLVLEFTIHYIEHNANYELKDANQFSLRLWFGNIAYFLGLSRNWQPLSLSPAHGYKIIRRLITVCILVLALAGSMHTVIAEAKGAWYGALLHIFTESDLSKMMTWFGGLLFAAAAVLAAQSMSRYVALRTVEVQARMNVQQASPESRYDAALDAVAVNFILAKVAAQSRLHEKDALEVASPHVPFSKNGAVHSSTE